MYFPDEEAIKLMVINAMAIELRQQAYIGKVTAKPGYEIVDKTVAYGVVLKCDVMELER
jgi:hypothetical protein